MLTIIDNDIQLTRGDTAYIDIPVMRLVSVEPEQYEEYELQETDTIVFTVKNKYMDETPVLQKQIVGSNILHLLPSDTSGKEFRKYQYDIELRTASGEVFTIVPKHTFELTAEVGW